MLFCIGSSKLSCWVCIYQVAFLTQVASFTYEFFKKKNSKSSINFVHYSNRHLFLNKQSVKPNIYFAELNPDELKSHYHFICSLRFISLLISKEQP